MWHTADIDITGAFLLAVYTARDKQLALPRDMILDILLAVCDTQLTLIEDGDFLLASQNHVTPY